MFYLSPRSLAAPSVCYGTFCSNQHISSKSISVNTHQTSGAAVYDILLKIHVDPPVSWSCAYSCSLGRYERHTSVRPAAVVGGACGALCPYWSVLVWQI